MFGEATGSLPMNTECMTGKKLFLGEDCWGDGAAAAAATAAADATDEKVVGGDGPKPEGGPPLAREADMISSS